MTKDLSLNNTVLKWAIVSWRHDDLMDGKYGKLLEIYNGSYEAACFKAREEYIPNYSLSVCGILEPV